MLSNILGQSYAVTVLENALADDRLAGSYLFVGPDGVGKATTAREFAKSLCGAVSDTDSVARAIDAGTFPDVRMVEPPRSGIMSIAQLWPRAGHKEHSADNAMLRDLHFEPMSGPKRVFIVNGAESLGRGGADAGNSILKTLEEPPPYANFILTAASTAGMMPTIVSRCQVVHFGLLPADQIEQVLVRRFEVLPGPARFLATYCEGRLGRAVSLARSPSLLAAREDLLDWARDLVTAPSIKSFKLGEELRKIAPKLKAGEDDAPSDGDEKEKGGREPLGRALDMLATYYRDMLAVRLMGEEQASLVNIDRRVEIAGGASHHMPEQLEESLALIVGIRQAIERNANAQLAVEVLLTHLTSLGVLTVG
jgi:DNA polymerase-3 subunit delta'